MGCDLSEAENFVFLKRKFCNIYGEYKQKFRSGNELKKKKVAEEEGGKHKEKTHSSLGLTGPNFSFGRKF